MIFLLTSSVSLLCQDSIVCSIRRRKLWLGTCNTVLLIMHLVFAIALVRLNGYAVEEAAAAASNSSSRGGGSSGDSLNPTYLLPEIQLFGGLYKRSAVMLCLDSLFSISLFTARCAVNLWRRPNLMVLLFSEVQYSVVYSPLPEEAAAAAEAAGESSSLPPATTTRLALAVSAPPPTAQPSPPGGAAGVTFHPP